MGMVDVQKAISSVAKGNPGTLKLLSDVHSFYGEDKFSSVIHSLRMMDLSGPQVWLCFSDYACHNLDRFIEAVRNRDEEMIELVGRRSK